jgi:hypothetical protein
MRSQHWPLWRTVAASSLIAAFLLAILRAPTADAALSGCRADPVFLLSDTTVLDVQVAIDTSVRNVDLIQYVVRGPRGVSLVAAISTPTIGFQGLEKVVYVADQEPNTYVTDTLVHTSNSGVETTSYTTFAANRLSVLQLRLTAQYRVVEGYSGQHLIATLRK